eukprot:GFUD01082418.1.p1 GENE.GFUD01082418.1~~GFUD01082418.1.p1  ORF type:complete len:104 (+),score=12.82 GFUD01082418.1:48-314(+)
MAVSTVRKLFTTRSNICHARGLAGLPNYNEASKIQMKSQWPVCVVLVGLWGVGVYLINIQYGVKNILQQNRKIFPFKGFCQPPQDYLL